MSLKRNFFKTQLYIVVFFVLVVFAIPMNLFADPQVKCPCFSAREIIAAGQGDNVDWIECPVDNSNGYFMFTMADGTRIRLFGVDGVDQENYKCGKSRLVFMPSNCAMKDYNQITHVKQCLSEEELEACIEMMSEASSVIECMGPLPMQIPIGTPISLFD